MPQVRIFGPVISTYTRICQIACEEAGLVHETVPTPAASPANRHPFGKVPVVEIDGMELIESVAITGYIDASHNSSALLGTDPARRAVIDTWVAIANNYLFPLFEKGLVMPHVMHRYTGAPLDHARIESALPAISRALAWLEAELAQGRAWTVLDHFTMADVFLYPVLRALQLTPQGEVGIAQCDHLTAWMASTAMRPSVLATRWEMEG